MSRLPLSPVVAELPLSRSATTRTDLPPPPHAPLSPNQITGQPSPSRGAGSPHLSPFGAVLVRVPAGAFSSTPDRPPECLTPGCFLQHHQSGSALLLFVTEPPEPSLCARATDVGGKSELLRSSWLVVISLSIGSYGCTCRRKPRG
ncbi:leucine-rich repeat extensin-like protein 7 [Iris pallida]|uniref:Leucine-rich repeat extensin-like protein 7 n=1 Tax=Iris pallida TaxID=29817 RepID=A0AAX6G502_IRIPA|nr:leucine-rich repeat extensin-like protein 7 [Iris pallida]